MTMEQTAVTDYAMTDLNRKIDQLTAQVAFLTEEAQAQQRRRQEWQELQNDLTPIASDVFRISVNELEEVESYVQLEDILRLFKRLLRNTHNLEQMLDQLESTMAMFQEISPLTQDAFLTLMNEYRHLVQRRGRAPTG
jgi:DNA repair exonuclease SbcCD ATPase subunit